LGRADEKMKIVKASQINERKRQLEERKKDEEHCKFNRTLVARRHH
jgi:hypothetical protein